MIRWPGIIGGSHKLASWLNRLRAASMQTEIKSVIGGRIIQNSDGRSIVIDYRPPLSAQTPFQIYQSDTWLKYKVRDGLYVGTGDPITVTNTETEIIISGGVEHYWIYLDCTATTAEVKSSASTLDWSSSKIPVGWIDTLTDEADDRATIYQLLEDNVFNPCAT